MKAVLKMLNRYLGISDLWNWCKTRIGLIVTSIVLGGTLSAMSVLLLAHFGLIATLSMQIVFPIVTVIFSAFFMFVLQFVFIRKKKPEGGADVTNTASSIVVHKIVKEVRTEITSTLEMAVGYGTFPISRYEEFTSRLMSEKFSIKMPDNRVQYVYTPELLEQVIIRISRNGKTLLVELPDPIVNENIVEIQDRSKCLIVKERSLLHWLTLNLNSKINQEIKLILENLREEVLQEARRSENITQAYLGAEKQIKEKFHKMLRTRGIEVIVHRKNADSLRQLQSTIAGEQGEEVQDFLPVGFL